ncbi:MAG: hypothetical protein KDD51_09715 [Bdellovibrionales bacterium]|nr:hypothetical protein [Bdellovibrionales bacterium]
MFDGKKFPRLSWHWFAVAALMVAVLFFFRNPKRPPTPETLLPPVPSELETAYGISKAERAASPCFQTYEELLSDGVLDVRIVFGYKDARPARYVGDRYERAILVEYLLGECRAGFFACGFDRDAEDADLFRKTVRAANGAKVLVRVRVAASSVGPDDEENRERDASQPQQSAYAERVFLDGLKVADVVFYDGHSRDGGGPDFEPPQMLKDDHVNYYWYVLRTPGLSKTVDALKADSGKRRLVGVFSCVSDKHFSDVLLATKKKNGLITSPNLIYYTEALRNLIGGLSATIGQFCKHSFAAAVRADESRSSRLENFPAN